MSVENPIDGTLLRWGRTGSGPPLVLVHGSASDRVTTWQSTAPLLEDRFTIYALDRRGRGETGDSDGYALEREALDVATVVAAIDGPVSVVGHSFGALCALEAAKLTDGLDRLVLYEPPFREAAGAITDIIDRLHIHRQQANPEGVLRTFFRDLVGMPDHVVESLRAMPNWERRVAIAETIPRELMAVMHHPFVPDKYREVEVQTLVLAGEESAFAHQDPLVDLAEVLPAGALEVVSGRGHALMHTDPELLATLVSDHVLGS